MAVYKKLAVYKEVTHNHPIMIGPTFIHGTSRARLTIVPVLSWEAPRRQGAPDQLPKFYHAVLMFECLVCV